MSPFSSTQIKHNRLILFYTGLTIYKSLSHLTVPFPANTRRWANAGLRLAQRRRRCANLKPSLVVTLCVTLFQIATHSRIVSEHTRFVRLIGGEKTPKPTGLSGHSLGAKIHSFKTFIEDEVHFIGDCFTSWFLPPWTREYRYFFQKYFQILDTKLMEAIVVIYRRCPRSDSPILSQQTWNVGPTLVYCWATVYDVDPTVNQRWANVSCLLGYEGKTVFKLTRTKLKDIWINPWD